MRKFILIDHSIIDSTGHHLEYARHVLYVAKELGFTTILGVNVKSEPFNFTSVDFIFRAFSYSYAENQAYSSWYLFLCFLFRSKKIIGNINLVKLFGEELGQFLAQIEANENDIIFIPTLGGVELLGINFSYKKNKKPFNWHLLFRYDFSKPKCFLSKLYIKYFRIRKAFTEFIKHFPPDLVKFYTDTEELSQSYNSLKLTSFSTLPIPIGQWVNNKVNKKNSGSLIVSYLGDAREDKGFHLLPGLISTIRMAGFDSTRVMFQIQVTKPLAGYSQRILKAYSQLLSLNDKGVKIVEGILDSAQYHELLLASDIILIPYCAKVYTRRSSGIFAEAVAAGIPTIYSEGTWMANTGFVDGSIGMKHLNELPQALIKLVENFPKYKEKSNAMRYAWRNLHSAKNLVCKLSSPKF